ncbi:MAG: PAS domain S-box protein, partial [Peptococcaceae bacterium]|nr:PAS domain S-box protein [Peptococcaceae bacterium]
MTTPLRVLIVEDSEEAARPVLRELRRGGYDPAWEIAGTAEKMARALDGKEWDIVISAHALPRFSGLDALKLLKEKGLDLPFLVVAGNPGEDAAAAIMKAGARDYIAKDNLARLIPVVGRELREAGERRRRRRAENALSELEDTYRTIFETTLTAMAIIEEDTTISLVNDGFTKLFGYSKDELEGKKSWTELIPESDLERLIENHRLRRIDPDLAPKNFEFRFFNKNGELRYAVAGVSMIPGTKKSVTSILDITGRKEDEIRAGVRNDLLGLFARAASRKEYLDAVTELLRQWSGCRCAGIRLLDGQGNIPYEAAGGFSEDFLKEESRLSLEKDRCICVRVIRGETEPDAACRTPAGSFHCEDISRVFDGRPDLRGACLRHGFASVAVVPVRLRDRIIGAIHLADGLPGKVSPKTVAFVESIAPLIGEAVHRFTLEEALQRQNEILAVVNAILLLSLKENNLDEILPQALGLILSLPRLALESRGCIFLVEEDPGVLVMKAHSGLPGPVRAECARVPFGECLCGLAAAERRVQFAGGPDSRHKAVDDGIGPHGHYCVPILSADRVLGVLNLYLKDGYSREPAAEEFLAAVANALAGVIARKRAETALAGSEALFRTVVSSMDDIVYTLDRAQRLTDVFGRWPEKSGRAAGSAIGKTAAQVFGAAAGEIHAAANERALAGQNVVYE